MKKIHLLIPALLVLTIGASAQNAYLRLGLGAAIGTANSMNYSYDYIGDKELVKVTTNGYGTGLPFALAGGYFFNDHFGLELGVDYFLGFASKYYNKGDYGNYDYKTKGSMLSIVPAFVGKFDLDKITPYARLGLMIGVMNSVITTASGTQSYPQKADGFNIEYKEKESGGVAIGVQAAIGTDIKLGELVSIFGEFQLYGISYAPKKGIYKKYTINGEDQLPDMTTNDKEWKFLKEVDYSKEISEDDPDECEKVSYHFNNVGIVFGVKINLP